MGAQTRWYPAALRDLLRCAQCRRIFDDNVAILVADDNGTLTDEQAEAIYTHLHKEHATHVQ